MVPLTATAQAKEAPMVAAVPYLFWFAVIAVVLVTVVHILTRKTMTVGKKAIWLAIVVVLPVLGSIVYLFLRPMLVAGATDRANAGYDQLDDD
jgi:membrane protein YdbS with pleckstrin-like domain